MIKEGSSTIRNLVLSEIDTEKHFLLTGCTLWGTPSDHVWIHLIVPFGCTGNRLSYWSLSATHSMGPVWKCILCISHGKKFLHERKLWCLWYTWVQAEQSLYSSHRGQCWGASSRWRQPSPLPSPPSSGHVSAPFRRRQRDTDEHQPQDWSDRQARQDMYSEQEPERYGSRNRKDIS